MNQRPDTAARVRTVIPDPALCAALWHELDGYDMPASHTLNVAQVRASAAERRRRRSPNDLEDVTVGESEIEGSCAELTARTYTPGSYRDDLIGVYCHGGGWVMGTPSDFDATCADLAHKIGIRIISPDYRLAPEHRFPAALLDIVATLSSVARQGCDAERRARVLLIGESAGGQLALAAAMAQRDSTGTVPAALLLVYPVVDRHVPDGAPSSPLLHPDDVAWYWDQYLGDVADMSAYALPGRGDLRGLPPTLIVTAEADASVSAANALFGRLVEAGVDAHAIVGAGLPHAFLNLRRHPPVHHILDLATRWCVTATEGVHRVDRQSSDD